MRESFTKKMRWVMALLLLSGTMAVAQSKVISGKITSSEDGAPLPGVNIVEKGTSNGTVTDTEGRYSITVTEKSVITFSFIGYKSQEITAGNQTTLDIKLETDVATLSEIVVVGYGQQEKKDVTGVVAAVESKSFNKGA